MTEARPTFDSPARSAQALPAWLPVISELVVDPSLQSMSCRFLVSRHLPVFRGHFPGVPIVPGVMQVGWAVELARTYGLVSGYCTGIVTAKFRRLMLPGMDIDANLERDSRTGQLQFSFRCRGDVVSTGRLQFGGSGV